MSTLVSSAAVAAQFVYLGTYTRRAPSLGIYVAQFDPASGTAGRPALAAEAANPTFLTLHPQLPVLYAVEGAPAGMSGGVVSAYRIDAASGTLSLIGRVADGETNGTYVSVSPDGRTLLSAHYTGGYLNAFPVREDGGLGECVSHVAHSLTGKHPQQAAPHPHCIDVSPDGRFAFVADLAADRIFAYRITEKSGLADGRVAAALAPGCGVRHLAFSPDAEFLYAINELGATVTVFAYDARDGRLREIETVQIVPEGFAGRRWASEVAVLDAGRAGKFLYASNRADDESIAAFRIDAKSGRLTFLQRTGGLAHPRHFAISPDGGWLLCANHDANNVMGFRIDAESGKLSGPVAKIDVPSCVCVVFWPAK